MVSRISLPEINGRVFEKTTGKSISGVIVRNGETVLASSDKRGFFKIKQKTYREFTFPGNEAPPLHFELVLEKQGYCEEVYKYHDDHGGASSTQPWEKSFHLQPRNMSQDCD